MGIAFDTREKPSPWTRQARLDQPRELPRASELFDGRYRVGRVIGQGGMAFILSAVHVQLDLLVAIKLLRPEGRECPEVVQRFLREGRASARIRNEHVARVFDVGTGPYGPFLVMEHLRGRDLERVLREDGPLSVECAVDYVLQAGEAIAEAHAAGVVHRDLKPANLFLARRSDGSPCVKVLDFGISKLMSDGSNQNASEGEEEEPSARGTDPSLFMGSPPYVSPEQAKSPRDVDARTDIWALGATLHELLVGEPPFGLGPGPVILMRAATKRPAPLSTLRSDVPPALEAAIERCLTVDLRERWASVADLADAIAGFGTTGGRASAGRIDRISGVRSEWGSCSTVRRSRVTEPVCAMDLVEPGRRETKRSAHARWGGYWLAIALVALTLAQGVLRWDAARRETQTAAKPPASMPNLPLLDPNARVARLAEGEGALRADRSATNGTLPSCGRTCSPRRPAPKLEPCKLRLFSMEH